MFGRALRNLLPPPVGCLLALLLAILLAVTMALTMSRSSLRFYTLALHFPLFVLIGCVVAHVVSEKWRVVLYGCVPLSIAAELMVLWLQ